MFRASFDCQNNCKSAYPGLNPLYLGELLNSFGSAIAGFSVSDPWIDDKLLIGLTPRNTANQTLHFSFDVFLISK